MPDSESCKTSKRLAPRGYITRITACSGSDVSCVMTVRISDLVSKRPCHSFNSRGFSLSNHLACARVLICLFERAPGNAREQIQSSCYCRVTGRVSLGGCDGQSSYLWFKDWRGSELRRFSSEGNIKAAFRFVLPACFTLSFLIIFFFCMGICLCHKSSTKHITYIA